MTPLPSSGPCGDGVPRVVIEENRDQALSAAVSVLRDGGVAVFPTETVYGVGVRAGDGKALARLRELKGRDADKPFQILTADYTMAERLGAVFDARARRLAERLWPGPLTMVAAAAGGGTLGVRVPDYSFILDVIRALGHGIVTSSANAAGMQPPRSADGAAEFAAGADILLDGGNCGAGTASTVVDCTGPELRVLRAGAIPEAELQAIWKR